MRFDPQAKLLRFGARVQSWVEGKKVAPLLLEVDPTNYCNARCPWCRFPNGGKTNIEPEFLLRSIYDLVYNPTITGQLQAVNWTGGGEPTLHPEFNRMTEECHAMGMREGLFTNGISEKHAVDPKLFRWIRFSLTDRYYGALSAALVREYRKYTTVGIVMCLTPENKSEATEMAIQAKELGANYFQVRPALARDFQDMQFVSFPVYLKELETADFKIYLSDYKFAAYYERHYYPDCYGYHFCPVIDHRGDVRVCNYFLGDDRYRLGNIYESPIADIIKHYPERVQVTEGCQICCKNHEINKSLYGVKTAEDVEFL